DVSSPPRARRRGRAARDGTYTPRTSMQVPTATARSCAGVLPECWPCPPPCEMAGTGLHQRITAASGFLVRTFRIRVCVPMCVPTCLRRYSQQAAGAYVNQLLRRDFTARCYRLRFPGPDFESACGGSTPPGATQVQGKRTQARLN